MATKRTRRTRTPEGDAPNVEGFWKYAAWLKATFEERKLERVAVPEEFWEFTDGERVLPSLEEETAQRLASRAWSSGYPGRLGVALPAAHPVSNGRNGKSNGVHGPN